MIKDTVREAFLWLLGALFVAIAAILMRVERWLLVRSIKQKALTKQKASEYVCRSERISESLSQLQ
jgi:hypothetical protein